MLGRARWPVPPTDARAPAGRSVGCGGPAPGTRSVPGPVGRCGGATRPPLTLTWARAALRPRTRSVPAGPGHVKRHGAISVPPWRAAPGLGADRRVRLSGLCGRDVRPRRPWRTAGEGAGRPEPRIPASVPDLHDASPRPPRHRVHYRMPYDRREQPSERTGGRRMRETEHLDRREALQTRPGVRARVSVGRNVSRIERAEPRATRPRRAYGPPPVAGHARVTAHVLRIVASATLRPGMVGKCGTGRGCGVPTTKAPGGCPGP